MAAGDPINDLSDLVLLATGGGSGAPEAVNFFKRSTIGGTAATTPVAGKWSSLWRQDGQPGSSTTIPSTSAVCTNATDGALKQATSATNTKKRLLSLMAACDTLGSLVLYDRLVHQGGLSGTATGAQTTNLPTSALTRYTTGVGVEIWLEIYTAIGSTATTITASYTDDGNNNGQTSQSIAWGGTGNREGERILPLPLAAGDKGARAVASVTAAASTTTAGNFGVTLAHPLAVIRTNLTTTSQYGAIFWNGILNAGGPLNLGATSDACLAFAWMYSSTTLATIFGHAFFVEK